MDYTQFLYMGEELTLLAVILLVFIADLLLSPSAKSSEQCDSLSQECTCRCRLKVMTRIPVILLAIHTVLHLLPDTQLPHPTWQSAFGGMYLHTEMMTILKTVLNVGTLVVLTMAEPYLLSAENRSKIGEFHTLTLFTLLGMYFMVSSGHFLMFFIGLELASLPMAALASFNKKCAHSAEAGAKYILLARFSSALLLYGISLLYGATGTLYFNEIGSHLSCSTLSILALILIISGLGFKISLVPFHHWTADTSQGAPTPVPAYLSVVSKAAAAFTLMVILVKVFAVGPFVEYWNEALQWLIVASITLANLFALRQKNLKRFMAFSAISQAGYVILGLLGGTSAGMEAMVYYLGVYMLANLGAFAIISVIEEKSGALCISDYNGLYQTNPRLAFAMTICLFSLAGIPPFAGFFSKFFIFMAAFDAGFEWVVFVALVNTVVSLYYYLMIVKAMYINKSEQPIATFTSPGSVQFVVIFCIMATMAFGVVSLPYNFMSYFGFGL